MSPSLEIAQVCQLANNRKVKPIFLLEAEHVDQPFGNSQVIPVSQASLPHPTAVRWEFLKMDLVLAGHVGI